MNKITFIIPFIVSIFVFPFCGCGNGQVRMSGRVTYSDNGMPLEMGTVVFATPTFQARGEIKGNGYYRIGSYTETDGLPPNTYYVFVIDAEYYSETKNRDGIQIPVPLIQNKFSDPFLSGLKIKVDASTKTFDFQVERAVSKK